MDPTHAKQIWECNWQVVNATNSVNYFHINKESRKPLIVLSPKDLLGHKEASLIYISEFDDVQGHPGFDKQGDQNDHLDFEEGNIRLILCSGMAGVK
ncbi:hypothetical protein LguiB_029544 [Lonicera macranthoides]